MHDLCDFKTVRNLLKQFRIWHKKRLGQHFLVDRKSLEKILEIADVQDDENVTEIGAGHGVLTVELLKKGANVNAIEIDADILPVLKLTTQKFEDKLEIFHQHILAYEQKETPYKVVANIPYQLTSPILRKFLPESKNRPTSLTLLMQKEVAEKICNTGKKSILSLIVEVFGKPEIRLIVPPESFFPPPKVNSAVLHVQVYNQPKLKIDTDKFYKMLKMGFTSPRKKLKNVLAGNFDKKTSEIEEILIKRNIPVGARAENLEITDWEGLADELLE